MATGAPPWATRSTSWLRRLRASLIRRGVRAGIPDLYNNDVTSGNPLQDRSEEGRPAHRGPPLLWRLLKLQFAGLDARVPAGVRLRRGEQHHVSDGSRECAVYRLEG